QEALDAVQLDDYNARLYDPALGRFLSVDPLIGHPESTQGINPYSYVENNPLNKTDPTGETLCPPRCSSNLDGIMGTDGSSSGTEGGDRIASSGGEGTKLGPSEAKDAAGAAHLGDILAHSVHWRNVSNQGTKSANSTGKTDLNNGTSLGNQQEDSAGGQTANSSDTKASRSSNPFAVTDQERALPAKGDLSGYWYQRYLQGDPVAPMGLAMWGNANEKAMVGPYWDAMGAWAMEDLRMGIQASRQQVTPELLHTIGTRLAQANNIAIGTDIQQHLGHISGVLSAHQITDYHADVFRSVGVSPSYFGGTPIFGQEWETQFTSGLWCQTCDPSDVPRGN
ncbi:MAG: RHS repeat-associated core domain-containing protein, partial [Ktedonobacteraceae bacterium]